MGAVTYGIGQLTNAPILFQYPRSGRGSGNVLAVGSSGGYIEFQYPRSGRGSGNDWMSIHIYDVPDVSVPSFGSWER